MEENLKIQKIFFSESDVTKEETDPMQRHLQRRTFLENDSPALERGNPLSS